MQKIEDKELARKLREKVNDFNKSSAALPASITVAFMALPELGDASRQKSDRPEDVPAPPDPPRPRTERPVSSAGLRVLARLRREVPVDLRLDNQELRCAEDIRAVVEACAIEAQRLGQPPPKTLTLGPWGHDFGCSCHVGVSDVAVLPRETKCDAVESAIEAFLSTCAIWRHWPLRSICLCELRLSDSAVLGKALSSAGPKVLRLQHLALRSAAASLLQAFAGHELEVLDLSGNNLSEDDFELLLKVAGPTLKLGGLVLSCNPAISQVSLQQLLSSPWAKQLQLLDLSECSIGPAGAMLLESFLLTSECCLRDLCLYRTGIGSDGVRRLVAAAVLSATLRSLDVTANAQHGEDDWMEALGKPLATCLAQPKSLKILTLSCPERQLKAAEIFQSLPLRVILIPNEQNNYNRPMFLGHAD
eukprot:s1213_g15.t1